MKRQLNINILRKDLIEIYASYLKGKVSTKLKKKATRIYFDLSNAQPILDKNLDHAVGLLGDSFLDFPDTPKPSKKEAESILRKLRQN